MLALDLPDRAAALDMLAKLRGNLEWVKIGLQMYLAYGRDFVKEVADMGFKVFLDLKLYDIPNTVASAVKSLKGLPVSMLTIHTSGGREMMAAAVAAAKETNPDLLLLGVTVLTSFDDEQKRVMTPELAAEAGSSFIVVGRPILKAQDPAQAARSIIDQLK